MITKEQVQKETEIAFEMFDKIKDKDNKSRYRVMRVFNDLMDEKYQDELKSEKANYNLVGPSRDVACGSVLRPY